EVPACRSDCQPLARVTLLWPVAFKQEGGFLEPGVSCTACLRHERHVLHTTVRGCFGLGLSDELRAASLSKGLQNWGGGGGESSSYDFFYCECPKSAMLPTPIGQMASQKNGQGLFFRKAWALKMALGPGSFSCSSSDPFFVPAGPWFIWALDYRLEVQAPAQRLVRAVAVYIQRPSSPHGPLWCTATLLPGGSALPQVVVSPALLKNSTTTPAADSWVELDLSSHLQPWSWAAQNSHLLRLHHACAFLDWAWSSPRGGTPPSLEDPFLLLYLNDTWKPLRAPVGGELPQSSAHGHRMRRAEKLDLDLPRYSRRGPSAKQNACALYPLRVTFRQLGWDHWIIAPHSYRPQYCKGTCPRVLRYGYNSPNHAIVQNLINEFVDSNVPRPSCVPYEYSPVGVLMIEQNNNILFKVSLISDNKLCELPRFPEPPLTPTHCLALRENPDFKAFGKFSKTLLSEGHTGLALWLGCFTKGFLCTGWQILLLFLFTRKKVCRTVEGSTAGTPGKGCSEAGGSTGGRRCEDRLSWGHAEAGRVPLVSLTSACLMACMSILMPGATVPFGPAGWFYPAVQSEKNGCAGAAATVPPPPARAVWSLDYSNLPFLFLLLEGCCSAHSHLQPWEMLSSEFRKESGGARAHWRCSASREGCFGSKGAFQTKREKVFRGVLSFSSPLFLCTCRLHGLKNLP
ncbi:Bone morphogenetic protein 15, partial [Ophiophagus hannah]